MVADDSPGGRRSRANTFKTSTRSGARPEAVSAILPMDSTKNATLAREAVKYERFIDSLACEGGSFSTSGRIRAEKKAAVALRAANTLPSDTTLIDFCLWLDSFAGRHPGNFRTLDEVKALQRGVQPLPVKSEIGGDATRDKLKAMSAEERLAWWNSHGFPVAKEPQDSSGD